MRSLIATLALVGLMVLASGCGSDDEPAKPDAGDPITVEQLTERSADTSVEVRGLLHIDQGVARLCAAILESHPPQCGEPSVELVDLDPADIADTTTANGVTWKEGVVLKVQRTVDARFLVLAVETGSD